MANKKINQLVLKTTIQSTDLFPLGDPTTGQLFKKTVAELQAAIGGAVISVNGLVGTVVLDTDDIQELASPTNKYFTDARARAAISLTTTGSSGASTYSSSTGVLNVPTYTLAGLGGITATFLSGGTGITYNSSTGVIAYSGTVFTDASIRALVSAGAGLSYNSSTGVFSYSGTVYTDSSIRALLSGTAPISYNNSTGAIGITQASGSTNGFLSSTDWTTFNNKQGTITLTTTGTSGAATLSSGTLNIPQYQAVLTNPVTGTGTTNYVTKWTSSSAIGNSIIQDNGTNVGIGTEASSWSLGTALELNNKGNGLWNASAADTRLMTNVYFNGGFFYGSNGVASIMETGDGFIWRTAPLGTANASATFTERMRITSDGNVGIGTTTPSFQFHLKGVDYGIMAIDAASTYNSQLRFQVNGSIVSAITAASSDTSMQFYHNGAERMRISSTGNVGIGITAPSQQLSVEDTILIKDSGSSASQLIFGDAANDFAGRIFYNHGSDAMQFFVNADERMRITSGGNVGIGTDSPNVSGQGSSQRVLTIAGQSGTWGGVELSANTQSGGALTGFYGFASPQISGGLVSYIGSWLEGGGSGSGATMRFFTRQSGVGLNEIFRLTGSRNMLIGTDADNGERLYVSGSIRATGSITANSDARLKKNIERIENALEKVGQISGYTYNTIYDEDRHAGVIAQEIDKVLPEIVNKGNDGLMGVEYGNISALLIEAIKDLKKDNESLRAIVEGLSK